MSNIRKTIWEKRDSNLSKETIIENWPAAVTTTIPTTRTQCAVGQQYKYTDLQYIRSSNRGTAATTNYPATSNPNNNYIISECPNNILNLDVWTSTQPNQNSNMIYQIDNANTNSQTLNGIKFAPIDNIPGFLESPVIYNNLCVKDNTTLLAAKTLLTGSGILIPGQRLIDPQSTLYSIPTGCTPASASGSASGSAPPVACDSNVSILDTQFQTCVSCRDPTVKPVITNDTRNVTNTSTGGEFPAQFTYKCINNPIKTFDNTGAVINKTCDSGETLDSNGMCVITFSAKK